MVPLLPSPTLTYDFLGFLRLVDRTALREMIANLLDTIMENQWDLNHITSDMCLSSMEEATDQYLLYSALNALSSSRSPITEGLWKLDYRLVSRNVAQKLFRSRLLTMKEVFLPSYHP
jgi:hypothetical protein